VSPLYVVAANGSPLASVTPAAANCHVEAACDEAASSASVQPTAIALEDLALFIAVLRVRNFAVQKQDRGQVHKPLPDQWLASELLQLTCEV
jgi:hypothetical protein